MDHGGKFDEIGLCRASFNTFKSQNERGDDQLTDLIIQNYMWTTIID